MTFRITGSESDQWDCAENIFANEYRKIKEDGDVKGGLIGWGWFEHVYRLRRMI